MKIKTILCALCAAIVLGSCSYDDDGLWNAVNGQEERISALEKWQKTVVEQLNSLQGILTATDYVTNVEQVEKDGAKGYKISFLHASPVTLYYNENSEVSGSSDSSIGVEQDDNGYYWTMNGEPLKVENQKVYVTGGGSVSLTPNTGNPERWDLTVGENTITVDPNAVGVHPVKSVEEVDGKVVVTLSDNTTKELVKWVDLKTFLEDSYEGQNGATATYPIQLGEGYIMRKLDEAPAGWTIEVSGSGADTKLDVTYSSGDEEAVIAFLISDGNTLSVIKEVTFVSTSSAPAIVWTSVTYTSEEIVIPTNVENVKVIGDVSTLSPADFAKYITTPLKTTSSVKNIDLSNLVYAKAFPTNAFYMNTPQSPDTDKNTSIETIILPQSINNMYGSVFKNCKALTTVTIISTALPENGVKNNCGTWFDGCDALEHVYVPEASLTNYKTWIGDVAWKDKMVAIPTEN